MDGTRSRSRWHRIDPVGRYGVRLTLLGAALTLVAVPFATVLFQVVLGGPVTRADGRLADALNDAVAGRSWAVDVLGAVSWLARPPFLALVVVAVAVHLLRRGQRRLTCFVVLTAAGGGVLTTVVKLVVDRPRPVVDHPVATAFGDSFPSGHALGSVVVYGALLLVFLPLVHRARRRLVVRGTALVVLAVGASRLLLGVHFLSDVVGGWLLGGAWLLGAVVAFEAWRHDEGAPDVAPLEDGVAPEAAEALR
jgi:undecaprenyl-diphosphatase